MTRNLARSERPRSVEVARLRFSVPDPLPNALPATEQAPRDLLPNLVFYRVLDVHFLKGVGLSDESADDSVKGVVSLVPQVSNQEPRLPRSRHLFALRREAEE